MVNGVVDQYQRLNKYFTRSGDLWLLKTDFPDFVLFWNKKSSPLEVNGKVLFNMLNLEDSEIQIEMEKFQVKWSGKKLE